MEKESIALIAQLLTGIKDSVDKLEEAINKKDLEKAAYAKNEILNFQQQIDKLL